VPALVRVFYAARLKIRLNTVFGIKKNPETIETSRLFAAASFLVQLDVFSLHYR